MTSLEPAVQPPRAPPRALPNVVVMTSTLPPTPWCSHVPRPVFPMNPVACESSTINVARYFAARSQICGSGATVPSIEKTPSVTIIRNRADRASFSFASRSTGSAFA